jgi:microsomal epoxide hydrolase
MSTIRPLTINVPDSKLQHIRARVAAYPWDEMPALDGWTYGTNHSYLRALCGYWLDGFDWRREEAAMNQHQHFLTEIDGIDVHFIHEKGSGPNPRPLILSHGWPGSVDEFRHVINRLAHPEQFGGDAADAFDVVAPSLPGFGFSGAPPHPIGPRKIAALFNTLMTDRLGYDGYLAQGGDWGGAVSTWLGYDHAPACAAIHVNIFIMRHHAGPQNPDEEAWEREFEAEQAPQMGYRTQQATKPQSLGFAMADSPVGVAAWIVEKFNAWSDTEGDDVESAHTKDALLANIMIYLVTDSFATASWIYAGRAAEGGRILSADGSRVETPTACALFPKELLSWPPRSYAERVYNVARWTSFPRGGHFAAMEEPDALIGDIQAFAREIM